MKIKLFESRNDIIKFVIYTSIFFTLLFGTQKVFSPEWYMSFYSAENERKLNTSNSTYDSEKYELWKKIEIKPLLSIIINPTDSKVDDKLMKSIKFNAESRFFKEKVTPLEITLEWLRKEPRWQVVWNKLILSTKMWDLRESVKVFVHELWHIVDLHYLPNMWDYDPSENFYNISWVSYKVKKKDSKLDDFVTWYALTNKYEDFAESFTFYVFHNDDFRMKASKNKIIAKKYEFFSKYIFVDKEFRYTWFNTSPITAYNWDSTKIYVNLKKYLYYIR